MYNKVDIESCEIMNILFNNFMNIINRFNNQVLEQSKIINSLKSKINNINTQKNWYKNKYNNLKNNIDKIIEKEVNKRIDKEIKKVNHLHELELIKKNQQIFELTNKKVPKEIICNSRKKVINM